MRIVHRLVAGYIAVILVVIAPRYLAPMGWEHERWDPVGPLSLLAGPPPDLMALALWIVSILAAVLVVLDRRRVHAGLALGLAFMCFATWRVSWGHVLHTDHLVAVHALVLGIAVAARQPDRPVLRLLQWITVVTYVLAGIAKLRASGWNWVSGDVLRNQVAFDNLRKDLLGDPRSPFAALVGIGWLWTPLALVSLAVELGAPIALLGRRWAVAWSVAAWGFHVGVLALMAITFAYPLSGIAFAAFLVDNDAWRRVVSLIRSRSRLGSVRPTST
jgi:hypothetical protein